MVADSITRLGRYQRNRRPARTQHRHQDNKAKAATATYAREDHPPPLHPHMALLAPVDLVDQARAPRCRRTAINAYHALVVHSHAFISGHQGARWPRSTSHSTHRSHTNLPLSIAALNAAGSVVLGCAYGIEQFCSYIVMNVPPNAGFRICNGQRGLSP